MEHFRRIYKNAIDVKKDFHLNMGQNTKEKEKA